MWRAFIEVFGGFLGAPMPDRKGYGLRLFALLAMIAALALIIWIRVAR